MALSPRYAGVYKGRIAGKRWDFCSSTLGILPESSPALVLPTPQFLSANMQWM